MPYRWTLRLLALAATGCVFSTQAALKYRIEDLGSIQGGVNESILPLAINDFGVVVGTSTITVGATRVASFIWEDGRMRPLRATGQWAQGYTATDVNDAGVAVGLFLDRPGRSNRPVLYRDGAVIDVGLAPEGSRQPARVFINDAGTVVGVDDAGSFVYDGTASRPLRIGPLNQPFSVWALNDRGAMAGFTREDGFVLYDGTNVIPLPRVSPRPTTLTVIDLNNADQLLVHANVSRPGGGTDFQSYLYEDGRYRPVGSLGPGGSPLFARALNDRGAAVGLTFPAPDGSGGHAFVWRDGVARDLNDLIVPDPSGNTWVLSDAWDINTRGQIVGLGRVEGSTVARGFIATPVPEPGVWVLLLPGLALLRWARGRAAPA